MRALYLLLRNSRKTDALPAAFGASSSACLAPPVAAFALAVSLGISLIPLQAGPVSVIDLGGLGGSGGLGFRISDTGAIAGWARTAAGDDHAFSSGGFGSLVDLNGSASQSYAYGINASGSIVGTSYANGQAHGTIWSSNGTTDLGAGTYGLDINSSGQVAGGNGQAFVYANGHVQTLGDLPGGNWSSAYALNDSGMVAGYGSVAGGAFRGFVWTPAVGLSVLGTLGGNSSYAVGVNNRGQVVGHSSVASGYDHAFVTAGGALKDLGTLGGSSSYAYGINNLGAIVGYSWVAGDANQHAFLYYQGKLSDLNSLIPADSGWDLEQAYGINDAGDIVGTGSYHGQSRAFLIDPISLDSPLSTPEPATVATLGAGLVLLGLIGRKRRK